MLWVRDAISFGVDLADDKTSFVDMLWKAREGNGTSTLISDPDTHWEGRAAEGSKLQEQDVEGSVVKRIRANGVIILAPTSTVLPDGIAGIAGTAAAGAYVGVAVAQMGTDSYGSMDAADIGPGDAQGAVSVDWMWWRRLYALQSECTTSRFEVTTGSLATYALSFEIDTRVARKVDEWGRSLVTFVQPAPTYTVNHYVLSWSVLLQLP